jgi:hypothetical protein
MSPKDSGWNFSHELHHDLQEGRDQLLILPALTTEKALLKMSVRSSTLTTPSSARTQRRQTQVRLS